MEQQKVVEQRRQPRIDERADAKIRIQSAPGSPDLEGRVINCSALDLSVTGIRLTLDAPVPEWSLLELEITLKKFPTNYWFTGTTVWTLAKHGERSGAEKHYQIGVRFDIANNPMAESWRKALKGLQAP